MKTVLIREDKLSLCGEVITQEVEYGVNSYGEGLFYRKHDGSWGQISGTGQFSAKSPKELMRKLRARFVDSYVSLRMVRGSAHGWD